jgi:hypothetical protein
LGHIQILPADATHPGTLFENPQKPMEYLSAEVAKKMNIPVPSELKFYYQKDDTVRMHFMSFQSLNTQVKLATIYRVNEVII